MSTGWGRDRVGCSPETGPAWRAGGEAGRGDVGLRCGPGDAPHLLTLLNSPKTSLGTEGARARTLVPEGEVKMKVLFPFQKATKRENRKVTARSARRGPGTEGGGGRALKGLPGRAPA